MSVCKTTTQCYILKDNVNLNRLRKLKVYCLHRFYHWTLSSFSEIQLPTSHPVFLRQIFVTLNVVYWYVTLH